jgi:hypothetical protein
MNNDRGRPRGTPLPARPRGIRRGSAASASKALRVVADRAVREVTPTWASVPPSLEATFPPSRSVPRCHREPVAAGRGERQPRSGCASIRARCSTWTCRPVGRFPATAGTSLGGQHYLGYPRHGGQRAAVRRRLRPSGVDRDRRRLERQPALTGRTPEAVFYRDRSSARPPGELAVTLLPRSLAQSELPGCPHVVGNTTTAHQLQQSHAADYRERSLAKRRLGSTDEALPSASPVAA